MVEEPLVNHWALALGEALARVFGDAVKQESPGYRFIPTIDVDNAYAYARKGLKRTIGGLWRDRRDMEARNFRFQVLRNNQPDPYDTYSLLHRFHHNFKAEPVWFFLVGQYGKYDKNINPRNTRFKALISSIANDFDTGLHPSYASNHSAKLLETEAGILAGITGKPVVRSRQHYLKIRFPDTYRLLAEAGIREDYSLGFADRPGFRAGIANPFRFFDLSANMATGLTIYPFQVMDTSLRQYLGLNPGEAVGRIRDIMGKIRQVNGTFISLWHNESLSEWKEWQGWSEVYWQLLHSACKAG